MDLHESAVTNIKGWNHKKHLNSLQKNYYDKNELLVKRLRLQLPQEPRSKQNVNDMTAFMLLERNNNRYMQQCIFSMASMLKGTEGWFFNEFKNTMECACCTEKFWLARGKYKKEFEFDYLFRCFFDANNEPFPQQRQSSTWSDVSSGSPSHSRSPWSSEEHTQWQNIIGIHVLPTLQILHQQSDDDEYARPEALQGRIGLCPLPMWLHDKSHQVDAAAWVSLARAWKEE